MAEFFVTLIIVLMHLDIATALFHLFLWPLLIGELFLFTRKDGVIVWRFRIGIAIVLLVGTIAHSHLTGSPPDELPARFLVSLLVFTKGVFLCILLP